MNPLKLQILLGAVDKLTAPLKAVSGQSRITAQDLVDTKKRIKDLESQSGQIDGYRTLGKQIGATRAQLTAAQRDAQQMAQQLANVEQPTKAMSRAMEQAKQKVRDLSQQEREMVARHGNLKRAMAESGINTKQLGDHQRRLKTDLASANTQLDAQRAKLGQLSDQQKRLNQVKANYRQTQELRGQIAGHGATALATGTAMGMGTLKPVIEFAKAETSVVDLKVSMMGKGGQVSKEFQGISDLATKLGNKLPGTTADFQTMMSTLIQQGMSAKSILGGLGEATAYLGVQLKMPFDQAAQFAAKLQDATGTAEKDMMGLMDTIQRSFYLGVDSNNMLNAFGMMTPALTILRKKGLEATNVLSPLVIMADQIGMKGESSGNAISKVLTASMDTGKIKKALDGNKFGLKLNFTDGKGEFAGIKQMYSELAKMKSINTEERLSILGDVFGKDAETWKILNLMIDKGQAGYDETIKKMADQASLQERVNVQLGTLGSLWDAATGTFTNAMVNFGEAIAPEIKAITQWIGDMSERLGNWAKQNPELSNTLMKISAIVSVITVAFGALSLAVAALLGPMAIMKLSFGILGIKGTLFSNMLRLLLAPFKMVLGVVQLLTGAFIRMGIALLSNPLTWIIGLVAALAYCAYLLYDNWDVVSKALSEIWEKCKAPLSAFWELMKELFSWTPIGMLTMHWGEIWAFFDTLPAGAMAKGSAIIDGLINGISAKWESLKAKVTELTSFLPDWMKGDSTVKASISQSSYLTGNYGTPALAGGTGYGPNIVTPPRPVAARGGGTTQIHAPISIVQQPGQSGADVAKEVSRELDRRERKAAASDRATLRDRN